MTKTGQLKFEMPAQGWSQFLAARKEMLDSFDKARIFSKKHKVETSHGNVAEAEFRKWLTNFLPKKYYVTSGYIISPGVSDIEKTPHFDVIIYEHLDSPILWIEENPDSSSQGRSLAIPAEYVKGVIEVKSTFEKSTVKNGVKHLEELQKLMSGIDSPDERYKMYLPSDFFCGLFFFELKKKNEFDREALNAMIKGIELRGFFGGIILRGEGHNRADTGKINLMNFIGETIFGIQKSDKSLLNVLTLGDCLKIKDVQIGPVLDWSESNFSRFAFDTVALLKGTFEIGRISSFHALGSTEWAESKRMKQILNNLKSFGHS